MAILLSSHRKRLAQLVFEDWQDWCIPVHYYKRNLLGIKKEARSFGYSWVGWRSTFFTPQWKVHPCIRQLRRLRIAYLAYKSLTHFLSGVIQFSYRLVTVCVISQWSLCQPMWWNGEWDQFSCLTVGNLPPLFPSFSAADTDRQLPQDTDVQDLKVPLDTAFTSSVHYREAANTTRRLLLPKLSSSKFTPLLCTIVRPHLEYAMEAKAPTLRADINLLERVKTSCKGLRKLNLLSLERILRRRNWPKPIWFLPAPIQILPNMSLAKKWSVFNARWTNNGNRLSAFIVMSSSVHIFKKQVDIVGKFCHFLDVGKGVSITLNLFNKSTSYLLLLRPSSPLQFHPEVLNKRQWCPSKMNKADTT